MNKTARRELATSPVSRSHCHELGLWGPLQVNLCIILVAGYFSIQVNEVLVHFGMS
jgi:hypothetical protein